MIRSEGFSPSASTAASNSLHSGQFLDAELVIFTPIWVFPHIGHHDVYPTPECLKMSAGLKAGNRIRVKEGVQAPDLPEFSLAGWTGTITQVSGKKDKQKVFVEWDESTIDSMAPEYIQACEEKQLYHLMVCLGPDDLEPAEE